MLLKELNIRQRCWVELIKDYDYVIDYHLGKTNVVFKSERKSRGMSCRSSTYKGSDKVIKSEFAIKFQAQLIFINSH